MADGILDYNEDKTFDDVLRGWVACVKGGTKIPPSSTGRFMIRIQHGNMKEFGVL
jgi:hypothetical protein